MNTINKKIGQACALPASFFTLTPTVCEECGKTEANDECDACRKPTYTSEGLVYVAVGYGDRAVLLESDCGILDFEMDEVGNDPNDVGLETPEGYDPAIWKAVVRFWGHKDYWGEYDSGFNVVGDWEEVESYPEPECAMWGKDEGACAGMKEERPGGEWSCDHHKNMIS